MYVYIDDPTCDIRPSWGGHCRNCAANTCAVLGGQRPRAGSDFFHATVVCPQFSI